MKILSIDIGIKNLAYCVLEIEENSTTFNIIKWDVINLCGEIPLCQYVMKNKKMTKKCDKKACVYRDNIYYCKTHAKKMNCLLETSETKIKASSKLCELKLLADKYNITYTAQDKKCDLYREVTNYINKNIYRNVKKISASDLSLIDVGYAIAKMVPQHIETNDIDTVIIENQISPLANRMKTIQGMVAQFFIMNNIKDIFFISATNKLKPFTDKKMNYKERKEMGITITTQILENKGDWCKLFNNHKKKDDLADSLLQGLWFLQHKNIISTEYITNNNI